jgi:hypothetical protein
MAFIITKPLEEHIQEATAQVNKIAGDKILSLYPQYKQANMTARYVELMKLNELTSTEASEIEVIWRWIKAIRGQSNVANTKIAVSNSVVEIRNITGNFISFLDSV